MSVQLIAWAYEQQVGSATEKTVLLALANAANHHTNQCNPRIDRLALETELGESTVRKALCSLADKGFIERERPRRGDGSLGVYRYTFPHLLLAERTPPLSASGSPPLPRSGLVEPEVVLEPEKIAAPPQPRPRNVIWDTLTEVFGEPTTRSAQKVRGKVCSSLSAARASPDEIISRAKRWPLHFDSATMTDLALEKHWDTLARQPLRRQQ